MVRNMKWHYIAMVALLGAGACSSSRQTAQNAAEVDDLYGNSGNAAVFAGDDRRTSEQDVRRASRLDRRQQRGSNLNPDYSDDQQAGYDVNRDEYYSELSARNVQRGISPDPGWSDASNSYNSGFVNGYNAGLYGANSWNRWGWNNTGFWNGLSLGVGVGSMWGWGGGFGGYSPFGFGSGFGYSPYAYNGFYDPFYGSYGFGGFNSWYSPYGFGGYGYNPYAWGGGYYRPTVINNNNYVTGADPYRSSRTYGPRAGSASARYNGDFNNVPSTGDRGGRRNSYSSGYSNSSTGDGTYYSNGSGRGSSRGVGSYSSGRTYGNSSGSYTPSSPAGGRTSSGNSYYERPSNRGYSQPYSSGTGSSRGSYSQPTYSQPSQPSYNTNRSYSAPSAPSYSAPSPSSGGGGGGYSSGAGSSRGPR